MNNKRVKSMSNNINIFSPIKNWNWNNLGSLLCYYSVY